LYGEEIPNQILATGKDVIVVVEIRVLTVGTSNRQEPNQLPISRSCLNHLLDEANYTLALLAIAKHFTSGRL
jgi:hypothetical protein